MTQTHHHGWRRGSRDERANKGGSDRQADRDQPMRQSTIDGSARHGGRGRHDGHPSDRLGRGDGSDRGVLGDRGSRGERRDCSDHGSMGGRGGHGPRGDGNRDGSRGGGRHGSERGGGGRGRDGAGRRVLGRGELPLVILALLNDAPRHGYEIIRWIETRCLGAYSPSAGVIYPTLTMLEEQDLTQADPTSEVGKRRYAITQTGRDYIATQRSAIQDAFARMDQVARMRARAALPDRVAQAMESLKIALLRHDASWDDPQDVERVATIIETAAAALAEAQAQAHTAAQRQADAHVNEQTNTQTDAQTNAKTAHQSNIAPDAGQQP